MIKEGQQVWNIYGMHKLNSIDEQSHTKLHRLKKEEAIIQ